MTGSGNKFHAFFFFVMHWGTMGKNRKPVPLFFRGRGLIHSFNDLKEKICDIMFENQTT